MEKINPVDRFGTFERYKAYYASNPAADESLVDIVMRRRDIPRIDWIFKTIALEGGESLLDIGCNTGSISIPLAMDGMRVVGIDLSWDAIANCNKICAENGIMHADFLPEAFEDAKIEEKFDFVVAGEIIEHVFDPEKLLDFCDEHCNKLVFITTPNKEGAFSWDDSHNDTQEHLRIYGADELIGVIEKHGEIKHKLVNDIIHIAYEPR